MKKLLIFFTAIILIACGDDSSVNQAVTPEKRTSVSSKYELGACNERNTSELVFVTNENVQYLCNGIEWNILQNISASPIDDSQAIIYSPSSSFSFLNEISSSTNTSIIFSSSSYNFTPSSSSKSSNHIIKYGSVTDSRDGHIYRTIKIGKQTWMADNLNYETSYSHCYDNNEENCVKYGRLYSWGDALDKYDSSAKCVIQTAMDKQGLCPNGWHIPASTEWKSLLNTVGGDSIAAETLRSTQDWQLNKNGSDDYGFAILPAGYAALNTNTCAFCSPEIYYYGIGESSAFWTSTEARDYTTYGSEARCPSAHTITFSLYYGTAYAYLTSDLGANSADSKGRFISIRCIKDSSM